MVARRFSGDRFMSRLERKLTVLLDTALERAYRLPVPDKKSTEPYPRPHFTSSELERYAFHPFFEQMAIEEPDGFAVGARVFMEGMAERNAERALVSQVLTRIARMVFEMPYIPDRDPRESEVSFMGFFITPLLENDAPAVVAWFEDMHDGNDVCGLLVQPTSLIRGILLSPSFDQKKAGGFWEVATGSLRFPLRVFSDPCMPDDGHLFSPFQCRRFGHLFSAMPAAALERFAGHMRDHADSFRFWKIIPRTEDKEERRELRTERLESHRRTGIFNDIIAHVADVRRSAVSAILLSPASA